MRNKWKVAVVCSFLFLIGCSPRGHEEERNRIDSLNEQAYRFRYVNTDSTIARARMALSASQNYPDGRAEARNNLAFAEYQRMNYDGVDSILAVVRSETHNPLLLLCADVMEMKTCQRTGEADRFFQVKSRAEDLIQHLTSRESRFSPHDMGLWVYAQTEYYIITSTYYFYQEQDSVARAELARVPACLQLQVDTVQWVYYNYMLGPGGLVEGRDACDILLHEFDYLFRAYSISRRDGLPYFEANCLQAFATMFLDNDSLIARERSDAYNLIRFQHEVEGEEVDSLPLKLAHHALSLFQSYNDLFQTACAYRTLGEVFFRMGDYEEALQSYSQALHCVNQHHLRYYGSISADTLIAFNPDDPWRSIEMEWADDPRISTVPEWIAGIRQQLSLTYSAMGMKNASDYNRNSYLDLLQATNQNVELENRTAELERQMRSLNTRIGLSVLLLFVALLLAVLFRRRMKLRSRTMLREVEDNTWQPYNDFMAWSSAECARLEEERDEQGERLHLAQLRMSDNKRKNIENRTKVSLVHAIVPFLNRIGGEVVRMKQQGSVSPERREYIVELVDEIDRCNDILTEWIKMEQGQPSLLISTFSLDKLFRIVSEGHYSFDQKKIELRVEPTEAQVKADESLTLFMINTLADNARKFTPEGGRVVLAAEETDKYVEVSVTDTGCGLSESDVDTLMHSKVYDTTQIGADKGEKGFGFGLMNCRGIIEKYKKTSSIFDCCAFGVRSRLGEGSTFYFRLPRVVRMLLLCFFIPLWANAGEETIYYDSVYWANVDGRYEDAIHYATKVMDVLNDMHPDMPPMVVLDTVDVHREAAELLWAKAGVDADYAFISGLRNELSLAALARQDWQMYHYNNRACIRLHKYIHQDKTLPTYFHRLEQTNRNSNIFLVVILLASVVILFFTYKLLVSSQMKKRREIDELKQYLQRLFEVAGKRPQVQAFLTETSDYPAMKQWAHDYQQRVADEVVRPMNQLQDEINTLTDKLAKLDYERNRLHVQNQVLDNCLSTIKHESMYYPSRIRQLVEKMEDADISQLAELVQYYHQIYTLLCRQADAQIGEPGFKRQQVGSNQALHRAETFVRRLTKRQKMTGEVYFHTTLSDEVCVLADEALLDILFEALLSGMCHDGMKLEVSVELDSSFVRFCLRDANGNLTPEETHNLFYPQKGHIPYLTAKQILREHDTYTNHPGCRLVAQPATDGGYEIYFTLPITYNL